MAYVQRRFPPRYIWLVDGILSLQHESSIFFVEVDEAVRFVVNLMLLQLCYARKEMHANMSHIQHGSITRGIDLGIGTLKEQVRDATPTSTDE
jgi:hypothetical protein